MESKKTTSVLKKIISVLLCIILIPVIVINIVLITNGFINKNDMPDAFGYKPMIVLSGSMSPVFEAGDMILIKNTENPSALQKDDIICYLISGKATTHRIIQVAEKDGQTAYITKGDFNNVEDRLAVMPDQIQGLYTGIRIPHLGDFLMFVQTPQGILMFVGVPFILYVLYDVFKRRKDASKKTAQLEAELAKLKAEKEIKTETPKEDVDHS